LCRERRECISQTIDWKRTLFSSFNSIEADKEEEQKMQFIKPCF
jgi:hypothetical protein